MAAEETRGTLNDELRESGAARKRRGENSQRRYNGARASTSNERTYNRASHSSNSEDRRRGLFSSRRNRGQRRNQQSRHPVRNQNQIPIVSTPIGAETFEVYEYYQPTKILGRGAYAVVCEALDTRTNKKVAIKKNMGVFQELSDAKRILRETKLLMHFDHEDVVKLLDVIVPPEEEIEKYSDVYLVLPKMETTLAKIIKSKHKLTEDHLQYFMYQMFRGLKYIHSAGVIHRDLKPENILINGHNCKLKITDFGLARGVFKEMVNLTEYVVTRWYRAPEVMCSARQYDEKVDVWSLGCIFAELLLGKPLFPGGNHIEQLRIIFQILGTPTNTDWIKTPEAEAWVKRMNPHQGKPLSQIFHMATPEGLDLLNKTLSLDPTARVTVVDGLESPYVAQYHDISTETECPPFNISFEYENSMNTIFGVRHMMHQELSTFKEIFDANDRAYSNTAANLTANRKRHTDSRSNSSNLHRSSNSRSANRSSRSNGARSGRTSRR